MKILSSNSKTGISVNFPIEETCDKSCPYWKNKTCYGLKGYFRFSNVKRANLERYECYERNPSEFFENFSKELGRKRKIEYVRINGIGDTPDLEWAIRFIEMAKNFGGIEFWIATRKDYIWKGLEIPGNVIVRYSKDVEGYETSSVVYEKEMASCPATTKALKNCEECGYICWKKGTKHVSYLKH